MTNQREMTVQFAQNLRISKLGEDKHSDAWVYDSIMFAIHKLGLEEEYAKDPLGTLANIIDPICHDFGGEEGTNGESYDFACSTCGWCGDVTKPNYCPHCGARVVRDA